MCEVDILRPECGKDGSVKAWMCRSAKLRNDESWEMSERGSTKVRELQNIDREEVQSVEWWECERLWEPGIVVEGESTDELRIAIVRECENVGEFVDSGMHTLVEVWKYGSAAGRRPYEKSGIVLA